MNDRTDADIAAAEEALRRYDVEGLSTACRLFAKAVLEPAAATRALAGWAEALAHLSWQRRLRREDWEEQSRSALSMAESAVERDGQFADAYRALAATLMLRPDQAERRRAAGVRAVELGPKEASNWYERWKAFGSRVDDGAIRRALELDSCHFAALHDLAIALTELGRHEQSVKFLAKAILINPDNPLARYNLAVVLARLGDPAGAERQLGEAAQRWPEDSLVARVGAGAP